MSRDDLLNISQLYHISVLAAAVETASLTNMRSQFQPKPECSYILAAMYIHTLVSFRKNKTVLLPILNKSYFIIIF
jgi:hypothetical protein